jgi:glycosyltransferase involved in cell wall biosynthesis
MSGYFKNWAVVSPKDDTGFGRQVADLKSVLGIKYHIVIPSDRLEGHPLDMSTDRLLERDAPMSRLEEVLEGLEGIVFPETHSWHPEILPTAKKMGAITIGIPNWEWFRGTDELWKLCDIFVCQSKFTVKIVRQYGWQNSIFIPIVLDLNRFPARTVTGKAKFFVHNAGIVNEDDRKGTRDTIIAFKRAQGSDIRLLVRIQKEVSLPPLDNRIEVQFGNIEDPAQLYSTGDVAIQPSKMEGNGFMVIEPFATGMPVITLDYPPMNEYVRQPEMLVKKQWFKRRAFPTTWVKHAHLRLPDNKDLTKKIEWCTNNDMKAISKGNRQYAEEIFSSAALLNKWQQTVDAFKAGKLLPYIKNCERVG